MALFLDTFVNKLDRKGRVSVPAAYRQQLASQPFQGIVAMPSFKHRAIHCGDLTWLAEVSKDLDSVDLFSDQHDDLTAALRPTDPINIQYTSGTTGFPKAATLSHRFQVVSTDSRRP